MRIFGLLYMAKSSLYNQKVNDFIKLIGQKTEFLTYF